MPVNVPSWTWRFGRRTCKIPGEPEEAIRITALGGSIPTANDDWIEGPMLVVKHLDALDTLDATGHIVLFNRAMDPLLINTGALMEGLGSKGAEPSRRLRQVPSGCW